MFACRKGTQTVLQISAKTEDVRHDQRVIFVVQSDRDDIAVVGLDMPCFAQAYGCRRVGECFMR